MSSGSGSASIPTSGSDSGMRDPDRVVLILCGLIASGKSTFAEALQRHDPQFRRCNQDDLGDRRAVEQLARESLSQGLSVCIDRTNFNASQRAYWIDIAHEFPGTKIWVIVFDTPYETCVARLKTRTAHPTITSPEQGLSVLARFANDFQQPRPHEGYERILFLQPADHPSEVYTAEDVASILQRVRNAPPITPPPPGGSSSSGWRGGRGGYGYGQDNRYGNAYGYGYNNRGSSYGGAPRGSYRGGYDNRGARGARGGNAGGYYGQHQQHPQYQGRGGGGSAYRGAYRGDGVGLYGGRPTYSSGRSEQTPAPPRPDATAGQSQAGAELQASSSATTGNAVPAASGHPREEEVLPIDD